MKGLAYIVFFAGLIVIPIDTKARPLEDFKTRFEEAQTAEEFDKLFDEFIVQLRKGKEHLTDADVKHIALIAKEKPYADKILPKVYGWAATMFGDGRMGQGTVYFIESANLYARQKKKLAEALCWLEVALIQHKAENYEEALNHYKKALECGKDSLGTRSRINCYNGLALIQRERGKYAESLKDFWRAQSIAVQSNDTAWIGIMAGNIGSIHLRNKNYDSSLYYYKLNLSLIKKVDEIENEIETYAHLARTYIGKGSPAIGLAYLDSARTIIAERKILLNDFFNPNDYIDETYAMAYAAMGNYKKAYEYYTKFHQLAGDKQASLNSRNLRQIELTDQFRQKESELQLSQQVNEANLMVIRQQRFTVFTFLFIIFMMGALALYAFHTSRQRKQLNKELAVSNSELKRLNKVKDKLFSVISHDLRGPLGNLQSILDLFNTGNLNQEEFAALSGKIGHQVKASGNALENLLQWAKGELSEIKTTPSKVFVAEVTDRVIHQFDENIRTKNLKIVNEVVATTAVWADENQLEIVLRNIIGNAIKFSWEGGTIYVSAQNMTDHIQIKVNDQGVGMTIEESAQLFQTGTRFTTDGTQEEKGTGIGLLISKEMIQKNKGTITIRSEKGSGSEFTISLPVA